MSRARDNALAWEKWVIDRTFLILPAVSKVAAYMSTYKDFPPRQRPASFSIDQGDGEGQRVAEGALA